MSDPIRTALRQTLAGLYVPNDLSLSPWQINTKEVSASHLIWMIEHATNNVDVWPTDKTSRWIGYVQGVLAIASNTFSVAEERNRTRPFFHEAYGKLGLEVPVTADPVDNSVNVEKTVDGIEGYI